MRASWTGAALSGVCAIIGVMQQAAASPLTYQVSVSGTGTATYSISSDDPAFQPRSGSGAATFSAYGENFLSMMTDITISIPGAGITTDAGGDPVNGMAVVTGISSVSLGPIYIGAFNANTGFNTSSATGEVTLTPSSVTRSVRDDQLFYTIAGTGIGDATVIDEEPNMVPGADPGLFTYETDITLDIQAFNGLVQIAGVPLPASAPMFGGALAALGAVGFGLKRRRAAAPA